MNNENTNLEPVQNSVEFPEVGATTPAVETPTFQTIDPTAGFQTVDPTATDALAPSIPPATEPVTEELTPTEVPSTDAAATEVLTPTEPATEEASYNLPSLQPPKATPVDMSSATVGDTRYNPVTGEEMNVKQMVGEEDKQKDVVNNEEKLKTVEVEYKPTSAGNTVMLIIFFIALIAFVVFLPELQALIAAYKSGNTSPEEIYSGKLVCTLESNTVNLDRNIKRVFEYSEMKLQSAKFTTVIRGDASLDEETLDKYNEECIQIHDNVDGLAGVTVACEYEEGKLTEKESFDYSLYNLEDVTAAYTEAGGTVLDFSYEQDIDEIMKTMRQSGFDCNKEK